MQWSPPTIRFIVPLARTSHHEDTESARIPNEHTGLVCSRSNVPVEASVTLSVEAARTGWANSFVFKVFFSVSQCLDGEKLRLVDFPRQNCLFANQPALALLPHDAHAGCRVSPVPCRPPARQAVGGQSAPAPKRGFRMA